MKKNYTSRFKILKGGKISLMVSALLVGVTTSSLEAVSAINTISLDEEGKSYVNNEDKSNTKVVVSKNDITYTNNNLLDNPKGYDGSSAIFVNPSVENFSLINKGTIQGGETSIHNTIHFDAISNSAITNDGIIKAAYGGSAIFVNDSKNINITNNGTIESSGHFNDYKHLIHVAGRNTENISITNTKGARILGSRTDAIHVDLSGGKVKDLTIDNQGEIVGAVNLTDFLADNVILKNSGDMKALDSRNAISVGYFNKFNFLNTGNIVTNEDNYSFKTFGGNENLDFVNSGKMQGVVRIKDILNLNFLNDSKGIISANGSALYLDYTKDSTINNKGVLISKGENKEFDEDFKTLGMGIYADTLDDTKVINDGIVAGRDVSLVIERGIGNSKFINSSTGKLYGEIYSKVDIENAGLIDFSKTDSISYNEKSGEIEANYKDNQTLSDNFLAPGKTKLKDLTNKSTGILRVSLHNTNDSDLTYNKIEANSVTLEDGSTIDLNVLSTNSAQNLLSGQTLQNVIQTEDLTVNLDKLKLTDNSALLKFEAELDNETKIDAEKGLDIKIKQEKTIEDAIENINPNIAHVGKIFDKMKNKDLDSFISSLNKKATDKEVTKAIKETTPVVAAALASTSNQVQQTIGSVISGRQLGIRGLGTSTPSGLNSGDDITSDYSAWTKIFGAKAKQDDKNSYDGYDFDSYGMAFGADKEFGENKRFGLAFVYANGEVKTNNVEQKSDLDIYNLVTYGSTPIFDKDTVLFYQLSLGTQETETKRKETTTGTTAKGDFRGFLTSASTRLIRNIKIDDTLLVVPTLKAMYTYMRNPSYKESGAGALNLNVDKFSSSSFQMGMGVDMEYKLTNDYTLLSNAMINYDLKEGKNVSSSSYAGDSSLAFTTQGMKSKRFSYEAGVGIKRVINEDSNLRFEYNYEGRDSSFSNQTVSLKYSWKF